MGKYLNEYAVLSTIVSIEGKHYENNSVGISVLKGQKKKELTKFRGGKAFV